ncbi:DUF624 domain-containing protein [Fundicoccus sp. Sow4_H7]|uniref:DUF624 domain-containing protein n=1 Tax=Fundicoccus sp. Sow4_H7 TaxID=3438784 RepID=UPI003F92D811
MKEFFSVDGQVFKFLTAAFQLLTLNLITLLFCLPIITIFSSFTAAFHVLFAIQEQKEVAVWRVFWAHFKANIKHTMAINVLVVILIGFLGVLTYQLGDSIMSFPIMLLLAFCLIVILTLAMTVGHTSKRSTIKEAVNQSLLLDLKYTGFFALAFSAFVIWFLIPIFLPRLAFLWFFFSLSLPMFLSAKIYQYALIHLTKKIQE